MVEVIEVLCNFVMLRPDDRLGRIDEKPDGGARSRLLSTERKRSQFIDLLGFVGTLTFHECDHKVVTPYQKPWSFSVLLVHPVIGLLRIGQTDACNHFFQRILKE